MLQFGEAITGEEIRDINRSVEDERFHTAGPNLPTTNQQVDYRVQNSGNHGGANMDPAYSVLCGTVPECVSQVVIEGVPLLFLQHKVEWGCWVSKVPSRPIFQAVSPKPPKVWSARGDLKPVMADEEEVVRFLLQCAEFSFDGDVSTEDVSKYFWRESGYVQ